MIRQPKEMKFKEDDRVAVLKTADGNQALVGQVGNIIFTSIDKSQATIRFDNKVPGGSISMERCYNIPNSIEFLRFAKKNELSPKIPEPIVIGNHKVSLFTEKSFNVGCQVVTWETYDKIGKMRPKK